MALVPIAQLLQEAEKGNYAVGAFNANNMEIVQAIMEAAQREKSPVIMQASQVPSSMLVWSLSLLW